VTFENLQILVDQQQIARGDFVETQAQLLSVIGAGLRYYPRGFFASGSALA
jgi:hypothetical protein